MEKYAKNKGIYTVVLKGGKTSEKFIVECNKLVDQAREENRKYENFFDMLKNRDEELFIDDWHYLVNFGWKKYCDRIKSGFRIQKRFIMSGEKNISRMPEN